MPAGLGHHHARTQGSLAAKRKDVFYPYGKTYAQTLGEQD